MNIKAQLSTLQTVFLLATVFITYRLIKSLVTGRRFRQLAKQQGCEEPLDDSGSFPYGWRTIHRMMYVRPITKARSKLSSIVCVEPND